jgi:hypothetical protein
MLMYIGNTDVTRLFQLRSNAKLTGVKGLRLMHYTTERVTHNFRPTSEDDGKYLKCIVTVAGLPSNFTSAKLNIYCKYTLLWVLLCVYL